MNSESEKLDHSGVLESMLRRLERLVSARFSCSVNYIPLQHDIEEHLELRNLLARGGSVERGGALYFPVYLAYQIVGTAEIVGQIPEAESERNQLSDLVELVLESAVRAADQISLLTQTEEHLRRLESSVSMPTNVIPLRKPTRPAFEEEGDGKRRRIVLNVPCLVHSESFNDIKCLAQEVHDISGRYAFVYFADLALKSGDDLRALGPATVFVGDITKLSANEQMVIRSFLTGTRDRQSPQLIVGTVHSYSELLENPQVEDSVLRLISVCRLRMTRSFEEYKRDGLMEFLFSSLISDNLDDRLS